MHPDKPGWYLVPRDGLLVFEPEYDPTNPATFDEEATIIFQFNSFFPGFVSLEFLSQPGYVSHAAGDGFVRLAPYEDSLEFQTAASSYVMPHHTKRECAQQTPLSYQPWASIHMGQGGHVPPIFGLGGHDHECPPPQYF